MFVLCFILSG